VNQHEAVAIAVAIAIWPCALYYSILFLLLLMLALMLVLVMAMAALHVLHNTGWWCHCCEMQWCCWMGGLVQRLMLVAALPQGAVASSCVLAGYQCKVALSMAGRFVWHVKKITKNNQKDHVCKPVVVGIWKLMWLSWKLWVAVAPSCATVMAASVQNGTAQWWLNGNALWWLFCSMSKNY